MAVAEFGVKGSVRFDSEQEWLESMEVSFVYSYVEQVIRQFWQLSV